VNALTLFLPCAAGVQDLLAAEVQRITGTVPKAWRAGVALQGIWRDVMRLNLHSRLAQRVLVQLAQNAYRSEQDLSRLATGQGRRAPERNAGRGHDRGQRLGSSQWRCTL
jgi:putative N6-adenine-specific DNA methylase